MMKPRVPFYKSFGFAWNGLRIFFSEEKNAKRHTAITLAVIILAAFLQLSVLEWSILLFTITLVFITEIINTALENVINFITTKRHPSIKKVKDLAAGAVLFSAFLALIIAGVILLPKCLLLFTS